MSPEDLVRLRTRLHAASAALSNVRFEVDHLADLDIEDAGWQAVKRLAALVADNRLRLRSPATEDEKREWATLREFLAAIPREVS